MWITSSFNQKCSECNINIFKGDRMLLTDNEAYCVTCGEEVDGKDTGTLSRKPTVKDRPRYNI